MSECDALLQIKAGLRVAVQPHGGHFWSSMGQVQRPMDIVSLRIDNQVTLSLPLMTPPLATKGALVHMLAIACKLRQTRAVWVQMCSGRPACMCCLH